MKHSFSELDQEILRIQQSTKTTLPLSARPHNWLRMHSPWYYKWHLLPFANALHVLILALYVTGLSVSVLTIQTPRLYAAAITWDGGGSTNNWSEAANWSGDVVPGAGDAVTFNSTSTKDAVVDASFGGAITSLTISSAYSGTISLSRTLHTTSTFSQAGGTFTAGSQVLDVDSTMSLTGGIFNAPSTRMTAGSTFTVNGATFNANGGTVTFDNTATAVFTCTTSVTFNLVTLEQAGDKRVFGCSLPLGNNPTVPAVLRVETTGSISGTGTLTLTGLLSFTTSSTQPMSGFTGLVSGALYVAGPDIDLSNYSVVDLNGLLSLSAGKFTAPSGTMTISTNISVNGGTFDANGGTIELDTTSSGTITCTTPITFNLIRITGAFKTISSGCTIPLGDNPTVASTVTVSGTLSGTGTLTQNAGLLTLNTGGQLSGFSGVVLNALTVSGATADFGGYSLVDINGAFALSSGTFKAPAGTMTVAGALTFTSTGTFDANGGTLTFDGSTATLSCNNQTFNLVSITTIGTKTISSNCNFPLGNNPTVGGAGQLTLNGTLSGTGTLTTTGNTILMNAGGNLSGFTGLVGGNALTIAGATADFGGYTTLAINNGFTMSSGSFKAPSATMSIGTGLSFTGGSFDANNGTVNFNNSSVPSGSNLSCNNATFHLVTFTHTTSAKNVLAGCNLPLGDNPNLGAAGGGVTVNGGTLSGTGTLTFDKGLTLSGGSTPLSGFTGLASSSSATLVVSGATVDLGSYTTTSLTALNLLSGTLTAPTGTMDIAAGLTISGGTFNANSGTVNFTGGASTLNCNNVTFNRVIFSNTNTKTVSSNCTMPLGNNPTIGSVANNGTLTGTGTATFIASYSHAASTSVVSGFSALNIALGLVIGNGADLDLGSFSSAQMSTLTMTGTATLTAPTTMRVSSTFTIPSTATFNHNNGTIVFASGTSAIACGDKTFHLVTFEGTTTKTISSDCSLPLGANPVVPGAITLRGTLTGTGTLTMNGWLTMDAATSSLSGFSGLVENTRLALSAGSLNLSSFNPAEIYDLAITNGATFTAPTGTLKITSRLSNDGGTFNHNNGTVYFPDFAGSQILVGSYTFNNLTKISGTTPLVLPAGLTQTILGTLTLKGINPARTYIASSVTGTAAIIDARGPRDVSNLLFRDVVNSNSSQINIYNTNSLTNGSITTGWNLYAPALGSAGPSGVTNGSVLTTTMPDFTFSISDRDGGDTMKYQIQIDDSADFSSPAVDYTSALSSAGAKSFKVGQALADGTYGAGNVGEGLPNGNYYWRIRGIDQLGNTSNYVTINGGKVAFKVTTATETTSTPSPSPTPVVSASPVAVVSPTPSTAATLTESPAPTPSSSVAPDTTSKKVLLQVRVVDSNQQPIVGALVTISSESVQAITDKNGIAIFPAVSPGTHRLVVAYNDQSGARVINLNATASSEPESVAVTVQLKPTKLLFGVPALMAHSIMALLFVFITLYLIARYRYGKTLVDLLRIGLPQA